MGSADENKLFVPTIRCEPPLVLQSAWGFRRKKRKHQRQHSRGGKRDSPGFSGPGFPRGCPGPPPPPFPPPLAASQPSKHETARKVTLGDDTDAYVLRKETETAVNDFLATVSLYDDVPIEERTKVLDSIPLAERKEIEESEEDGSNDEFFLGSSGSEGSESEISESMLDDLEAPFDTST